MGLLVLIFGCVWLLGGSFMQFVASGCSVIAVCGVWYLVGFVTFAI